MLRSSIPISVVLPTHNGERLIGQTLERLVTQTLPKSEYEILVVDNRSTDRTREIVNDFSRNNGVTCLYEERLGAAVARNTGWRNARGRWIAFVDDDIMVPSNWLASILDCADSVGSTVACVGGPVAPIWEESRPAWLEDELLWPLAIVDWSNRRKELTDISREWLVSANMAVRRDALKQVGGFHPQLDKVGNRHLGNGETHLQQRLIAMGHSCVFDPTLSVMHYIRASRLTQTWFLSRYYNQGLSDFAVDSIESKLGLWRRCYTAIGMTLKLLRSRKNLTLMLKSTQDPSAFRQKCYLVVKVGYVAGLIGVLGR